MAFSIETIKDEICGMVDHWEKELQAYLYEEYENIKKEIEGELYDEIAEKVDEHYLSEYNFSLYTKSRNENCQSNVYFISDGEFCKIGKADNIDVRIKQLQISNAKPLFVIGYIQCENSASALRREKLMHRTFLKKRMIGEWYKIDVAEVINILKKYNGTILIESEE